MRALAKLLILGTLLSPVTPCLGQERQQAAEQGGRFRPPPPPPQTLTQAVIDGLLEQSYITGPGTGTGPGRLTNLLFEANVAPPFYVTAGNRLLLVATPKVVMRMLHETSRPVRTPSYMPRLSAFVRLFGDQFLTATVSHHSNGQEDSTLLSDGTLNLRSGNFSTNFVDAGLQGAHRAASGAVFGYRASFEYHPPDWTDASLRQLYPPRRARVGIEQLLPIRSGMGRILGSELQLTVDLTYYDGGSVPPTRYGPSRMGGWYSLSLRPVWLRELTLFANAYSGPDYYNIHFLERLNVIRFGVGSRRASPPFGPVLRTPS